MTGERIVVKGTSLDDIAARVRTEHGPRARIVAAERVTSGGIGIAGLFQKRYVEATVELPATGRRSAGGAGYSQGGGPQGSVPQGGGPQDPAHPAEADAERAFAPTPAQRVGLAALLADAEDAEEVFAREDAQAEEPSVSTRSGAFADLMDDLTFNGVSPTAAPSLPSMPSVPVYPATSDPGVAPAVSSAPAAMPVAPATAPAVSPAEQPPPAPIPMAAGPRSRGRRAAAPDDAATYAPALLEGPGDLVVVLGERPDTAVVAQAMAEGATGARAAIRVAGTAADGRFVAVTDKRSATEARAAGVELDRSTLVAIGWDGTAADVVAALAPDQIWIAVDAGRKHADTERFVAQVRSVIDADGLAVTGIKTTSTPDTVRSLGLPIGWADA